MRIRNVKVVEANPSMYVITADTQDLTYHLTVICTRSINEPSKYSRNRSYSHSYAFADNMGNASVDRWYGEEKHPMTQMFVPMVKKLFEAQDPELVQMSDDEYYALYPDQKPSEAELPF